MTDAGGDARVLELGLTEAMFRVSS